MVTDTTSSRPRSARRLRAAVFGASGTTGVEVTRLVLSHPHLHLAAATSRGHASESLRVVDPSAPDVTLVAPDEVSLGELDVALLCLPHGASAGQAAACVAAGLPTIDLSGDLRLRDPATHDRIYGSPRDPEVAARAVYGMTEMYRGDVSEAKLVANPGCYPTCTGLALWPLAQRGLLRGTVVVNALSGVSGAGRKATPLTHYLAVADDVRPYKLGRAHRHAAEIGQCLDDWTPEGRAAPELIFCPHVVPMERGMLATITVELDGWSAGDAHALFVEAYADAPLVEVLPLGEAARVRAVTRTPRAVIGLHEVAGSSHLVITSALDNLMKGAASQAIQNLNLVFGYEPTAGLHA